MKPRPGHALCSTILLSFALGDNGANAESDICYFARQSRFMRGIDAPNLSTDCQLSRSFIVKDQSSIENENIKQQSKRLMNHEI